MLPGWDLTPTFLLAGRSGVYECGLGLFLLLLGLLLLLSGIGVCSDFRGLGCELCLLLQPFCLLLG